MLVFMAWLLPLADHVADRLGSGVREIMPRFGLGPQCFPLSFSAKAHRR
jgi:hypothetical protein